MTCQFTVDGEDLSGFVTNLYVHQMHQMLDTHKAATYGGKGLIVEVEGSFDSDDVRGPVDTLRGKSNVRVDVGDIGFSYEEEMTLEQTTFSSPVAGIVLWKATLITRRH